MKGSRSTPSKLHLLTRTFGPSNLTRRQGLKVPDVHPLDSSHSSRSHSHGQLGPAEEEKKCHELSFLFEEGYGSEDAAAAGAAGQSSSYEDIHLDRNLSQPMSSGSLRNERHATKQNT